jgi:hypothetical protein
MNKDKIETPEYSVEVFEDYALIRGWLSSDVLTYLIKLCKKEGFTHLTHTDDGRQGFKLVRIGK